jgi:arylsulfatase A-like enzyme
VRSFSDQGRFFNPLTHYEDDKKLPAVERGKGYYGTIEIADKAIESFPGQSLKPVFAQEINWQRNIWHYHEGNRAVRSGNWKLVAVMDEPWELFNLDNDRTETYNLAGSNPEKVIEMETLWNTMLNEISKVAPQKNTEKQKASVTTENLE